MVFGLFVLLVILFLIVVCAFAGMSNREQGAGAAFFFSSVLFAALLFWFVQSVKGPPFPFDDTKQYELEIVERDGRIYAQNYEHSDMLNVLTHFGEIPPKGSKVMAKYHQGGWYLGLYSWPQEQPNYYLEKPDASEKR